MRLYSDRGQAGYTLVEVLAAAMVLLVGILGTLALLVASSKATASAGASDAATSLAREILEKARASPYASLDADTVEARLRADPKLTSTTSEAWTIRRRNLVYTVDISVCAIDDAGDGHGNRSVGTFCAGTPAAGTADPQPEDAKRINVRLEWTVGGRTHQRNRSVLRTSRGGADAPRVLSVVTTSPAVSDPVAPVITTASITAVTFTIATTSTAETVILSAGGVDAGLATSLGNGRDWRFTLDIAGLQDGTREIGARAVDALGQTSTTVTIPLVLDRWAPGPPSGLRGGRNEVFKDGAATRVAEFDWLPSDQPKIVGYRTYRPDGSLVCPGSTSATNLASSCTDFSPQTGTYSVVALYYAGTTLTEGAPATVSIPSDAGRTYYLKNSIGNKTGACGTAKLFADLVENFAGADPEMLHPNTKTNDSTRFCGPALAAGTTDAGTARVVAFMTNTSTSETCPVTFDLFLNATRLAPTATVSVPPAVTTPQQYTVNLAATSATIPAGAQINLLYTQPSGAICDSSHIRFSGTVNRSRLVMPLLPFVGPQPPTAPVATRQANGAVDLSWTASPDSSVAFYRIYRDGREHTNRYDTTGGTDTTYSDPNRDGGTHTYRVTAVTSSLAESTQTAAVTG